MRDDLDTPTAATPPPEAPGHSALGMKLLRRRRWYLWSVILVYLPLMWTTLRLSSVFQVRAAVFAGWFFALLIAALLAALVRCPRCGNYFHLHGMTFLCLRRCLHCQLHVNDDTNARPEG